MTCSARRLALATLVLAGCSAKPTATNQALLAAVSFENGATSQCVRVFATPASGAEGVSLPIDRKQKQKLNIAVFRASGWSDEVTLTARGYVDCSADAADFTEESAGVTRTFPSGEPETVELLIKKKRLPGDLDDDGKTGVDDCDETDPERFVGNAESCTSPKDNNCSLTTGCADPLCSCFQSTDPCKLDAGSCVSPNSCVFANAPSTNSCDDGDLCTQTDTCNNGACIGQNPRSCPAQDLCHDAGTCAPSTGACSVAPRSCPPANACQSAASCALSNGACTSSPANEGNGCNPNGGICQSGMCLPPFTQFTKQPTNFAADGGMPNVALNIDCVARLNTGVSPPQPSFRLCNGITLYEDAGLEVITQPGGLGLEAILIRASTFTLADAGIIEVRGLRPAIIAVYGDANLRGTIEANAEGARSGNGANFDCDTPDDGVVQNANSGGSGGEGGAYGASGGLGGGGDGTPTSTGAPTARGGPDLSPLRGGCSGGVGGSLTMTKPFAGGGGGAVQVSVAGTLNLSGRIMVNGGGSQGGLYTNSRGDGAGGAGSGGAVLIEAKQLVIRSSARIFANGGSGGEGGGQNATRGVNGRDGLVGHGQTPANSGVTEGIVGGLGGGADTPAGSDPLFSANQNEAGGGGGGGSAGRIRLNWLTGCRENNYVVSPGSSATTSTPNAAFTTDVGASPGSLPAIGGNGICP